MRTRPVALGVVPVYLVVCAIRPGRGRHQLGTGTVSADRFGEFVLRFRAPPGTNYELTRQMAVRCLEVIEEEAGQGSPDLDGLRRPAGTELRHEQHAAVHARPDDGQMRVALREDSGVHLDEFRERLRKALPERMKPWFTVGSQGGLAGRAGGARPRQMMFGFEPGDIVSEVMSFGSPTPIEIVVCKPATGRRSAICRAVRDEMNKITWLRDVQIQQTLDYPTVPILIDRQKAGLSGVDADQVADRCSWPRRPAARWPGIFGRTPGRESATRCRSKCQFSAWIRRNRPRRCRSEDPGLERP